MLPKTPPLITTPLRDIRLIEAKAAERKVLREHMIKERTNPFKAIANNGTGFIEDPAFIRYEASQSFISEATHFRGTFRSAAFFLGFVIGPMIAIGWYSEKKRGEFDKRCRNGEISYRNRNNKFST